jgi:rhodanese-related sulfurtransferase
MMKWSVHATSFGWVLVLLAVSLVVSGCSEANEPGVTEISQQELMSSPPAGALILDVRTQAEFSSGHVPGAVNIPHDELALRLSDLDSETDRPVIVYCRSGKRAGLASTVLLEAGYTNVLHLDGDMNGWKASGLPTE